ncbi:MAG: GtrA family protein [Saprospiraceae bacterium]|nr:GtrA family protein [Saprospiraceae bacterium]
MDQVSEAKTLTETILYNVILFSKAQVSAFIGGLLDILIMIICVEVFSLNLVLAITLGGIFGAVVNFLINKYWTFKNESPINWTQSIKFVSMVIGSIILKSIGTLLLTDLLLLDYKLSRLITDAFVCLGFNFLLQKFWIFNK